MGYSQNVDLLTLTSHWTTVISPALSPSPISFIAFCPFSTDLEPMKTLHPLSVTSSLQIAAPMPAFPPVTKTAGEAMLRGWCNVQRGSIASIAHRKRMLLNVVYFWLQSQKTSNGR